MNNNADIIDETLKKQADKIGDLTTDLSERANDDAYSTDTGTLNNIVISDIIPTTYKIGQIYRIKAKFANTGVCTIKVGTLAIKSLRKHVTLDLVTGDVLLNQIVTVIYDGVNFQIIPDFKAQFDLKADKSATTEYYDSISKAIFQNANYSKGYMGSIIADGTTWGTPNDAINQGYQIIYIPNGISKNGYGVQILTCYFGTNAGKTFIRFSEGLVWGVWKTMATTETVDVSSLLLNGWAQQPGYSNISINKTGNLKTILGYLKVGTTGTILNLPAGFAPSNAYPYKVEDETNTRYGLFTVSGTTFIYITGNLLTTDKIMLNINYI